MNVVSARALHKTAFPDGLEHVDDPIEEENRLCRTSLDVLRSPEYAATITAIELPVVWLDKWQAALDLSDKLNLEIAAARQKHKTSVGVGQDAEVDFDEVMTRLRHYVSSRAKRTDKARVAEGRELLAPLTDAIAQAKAAAAARATQREKGKKGDETKPAPAPSDSAAPAKETSAPTPSDDAAPTANETPTPATSTDTPSGNVPS